MNIRKTIIEATPLLINGAVTTIWISAVSIVFGIIVGISLCSVRLSERKYLQRLVEGYVWLIRSTPMILQAFIVYFGIPQLIQPFVKGFTIPIYLASIITLSLNCGAYLSEVFRSGISAVGKGQVDASRSLGITKRVTFRKVVLPQTFRIVFPAMVNQFIILIKDTSILSVIGLSDLMNRGRTYVGLSYQFFSTYIYVAVFYCIIISVITMIARIVEKKYPFHND